MSERWATIVTDEDGQDIISSIAQMEGSPPDVRKGNAKVERVAEAVKIGMVRGGGREAVGEWGYPGEDPAKKVKEASAAKSPKTAPKGRGGKAAPKEPEQPAEAGDGEEA